jgi:hypothetical protein
VDTTKSGTATVTVLSPTVTGVTVSPATVSVDQGGTQGFTATVNGTNNPAKTVTWTVTGGLSTIDIFGTLTVAANETAANLTVRATSTADTSKSGTATVTVNKRTWEALTGAVSINGTLQVGYSLTANTSNLKGSGAIRYQWKRGDSDSAEGTNISGATANTYALVPADQGKYISVTVTRAENSGSVSSAAVGPVDAAPANTSSLTGTVTVSDGISNETVSFTNTGALILPKNGNLTVTVNGAYQAYRWFIDNTADDETGKSLTLQGSNYTSGTSHRILVIVYKNGIPYSQEITFTVGN